jgi:carboxyl-terminal processing protease
MFRYVLIFSLLSSFSLFASNQNDQKNSNIDNDKRFEHLELFNKVLYLIETQYYREVNSEKLIEGAIKGMMETLDPHSSFLNKEFFEKMQNDTQGEFGGLGLEVTSKEGVIFITPIEDTPAFRAGIRPKDKLVEINHEPIVGMNLEQAVEKMKGKIGESIHLGVIREGVDGIKHFNMKRELIKVKPVKYELLDEKYAYIRLIQFQKRSTENVVDALKSLNAKADGKLAGIILDLRSNPGGLLDQAVDISSIFLGDGVVVSTESRDPQNKDIRYVKKSGYKDLKTPLVVLINGASASASEIVAGALQDYHRAVIMGSQSFGKGSVQTVAQLDKSTGVKLTIAQYMTPKNRKIQAVGIKPDINLDEVDQNKFEKTIIEDQYIREKDLKNHLVSTIETETEEKERVAEEKEQRTRRLKELEEIKKNKNSSKSDTDIFKVFSPSEDYQVLQALRYLQGFSVFKESLNLKNLK